MNPLYDRLWERLDGEKASIGFKSYVQQTLWQLFRGIPQDVPLGGSLSIKKFYAIIVVGRSDRPFDRWAVIDVCQKSDMVEVFVHHETRTDAKDIRRDDLWKVGRILCD